MTRTVPALLVLLPILGFCGAALRAQDAKDDAAAAADADAAAGPELMAQKGKCSVCHQEADWRDLKDPGKGAFNHASTGFPLRQKHADAKCSACHTRGLKGLSQTCSSCHRDPHGSQNTKNCTQCHTESTWRVPRNFFNHDATRFPLMGKHAAVGCEACHRNARSEPLRAAPTECIVCHARDQQRSATDHTGFSLNCATTGCHTRVIPPRTFKIF